MFARRLSLMVLSATCLASVEAARAEEHVDVELVLAVDVSRSMSFNEQLIQRKGYAAALTDPNVIKAISYGLLGRIAVTYIEWAGDYAQNVVVDWTIIENEADAAAFAAKLETIQPTSMRRTSISGGINFSAGLFSGNGITSQKQVIDVSGDGPNNQGEPVTFARDRAVDAGIIINGLPLMTSDGFGGGFNIDDLDEYYINCVIGGPGSFSIPVTEWQEFPAAVRRKLILELAGEVPGYEMPEIVLAQAGRPYDCLIGEKIRRQREMLYGDP